ncbi:MAG: cytochrome c peroxidase, partial [Deltaproteobacteria bacterium]
MANETPSCRRAAPILAAVLFLFAGSFSFALDPDPVAIRILASNFGMGSLRGVVLPESSQISTFVQDRTAAVRLGKALFWDMQVGSDGQACGSCHFHSGADDRAKNQLQPGLNGGDTVSGNNPFNGFLDYPGFGPNYTLTAGDFPFHLLSDTANTNSSVLRDTNDVVSSQGVFKANFLGIDPLAMHDVGAPVPDPVFHVNGINTRRVEPRNTPTMINAAYNIASFWEGRANFFFNGVNPFGPLDSTSGIHENVGGVLTQTTLRIPLSSLASQAVGPPLSENEMSFVGRKFPDVGRKLIPRQPLSYQLVHPQDSILGPLSRATLNPDGTAGGLPGLSATYDNMIRTAFN